MYCAKLRDIHSRLVVENRLLPDIHSIFGDFESIWSGVPARRHGGGGRLPRIDDGERTSKL